MNNSAVNFTIHEASTNLTMSIFNEIGILECNVFGLSFMIGLPSNAYVIWLIITGRGIRVPSDFFILNLSVCGLFFSINSLLMLFTKWFLSPSLLALSEFLLGLVITGSPLFQCLLCVERYLAVVHPVTFLKYKPLRYRVICCTAAWIIILGSCLICMLSFLKFTMYMYMWYLSVQFLIFFSIKLFCCVAVLRALKQSGPGEKVREREEENNIKRRVFYLILITTVNTVITYVQLTITVLVSALTEQLYQTLWSVSYVCFMLAGFVPPVLYLHRLGKLSCLSSCNILC